MKIMKLAAITVFTVVLLFPLYWMLIGSVQDIQGIFRMPPAFWPQRFTFQNYVTIFAGHPIGRWLFNTMIITASGVMLSMSVIFCAGYAFTAFHFWGKRVIFWLFVSAIMIPYPALIIPKFVIVRMLGLSGRLPAAFLPDIFWPMGIILFHKYSEGIPKAIFDSARIDGANEWQIIFRVAIQLCTPVIGALIIFKSFGLLGDFIWQNLVLQDEARRTLIVGLINAIRNPGINADMRLNQIGQSLAVGTILLIPLMIVFAIFQRYFISGVTFGSVNE